MSKTFILGREGNQHFTIKQQGVSREHAKLSVTEESGHEIWTLQDLGAGNGTFIRDENGAFVQVGNKVVKPDTLICLGPDNANGCKFYARHVLSGNNYAAEFNYLEEKDAILREKMEKTDDMAKNIRKVVAIVSALALVGSFVVPGDGLRMLLLRVGTLVSVVSALFYDPSKEKKRLKQMQEKFFECPNPECSHSLTSKEVHNRRCSKCKVQG